MIEKYLEVIFKPEGSKEQSIEELTQTLTDCVNHKCYRIALNISLLNEIDYIYIISLVSLLSDFENKGVKFCLLGVDSTVSEALEKAYLNESIQVFAQRKLFFSNKNHKIIHTHIMGQDFNYLAIESTDENSEYVNDPTCCAIAGEYQCSNCGNTEYFMKGVTFETCSKDGCNAHILDWVLVETLF